MQSICNWTNARVRWLRTQANTTDRPTWLPERCAWPPRCMHQWTDMEVPRYKVFLSILPLRSLVPTVPASELWRRLVGTRILWMSKDHWHQISAMLCIYNFEEGDTGKDDSPLWTAVPYLKRFSERCPWVERLARRAMHLTSSSHSPAPPEDGNVLRQDWRARGGLSLPSLA